MNLALHLSAVILLLSVTAFSQPAPGHHTLDPELRQAVEDFVKAVDSGDTATVAATYTPDFLNVRVADDGGFVQLTGAQILSMLKPGGIKPTGTSAIPTKETTIHHAEVSGDTGYVLMTRVKNLGSGFEPMFYSLIWRKHEGKWRLFREFVHQRTSPKRH